MMRMIQFPLVSIVLPVFNTERYVRASIESLLQQTYPNIEIICINDGSTDDSLAVLQSFGSLIQIIDLPNNGGIATARNAGIAVARGAFIAFADADDLWEPHKLTAQMDQFLADAELSISFCMLQNFLSPDLSDEMKQSRYCPPDPVRGYISGTAVIKRSVFDTVGLLNPSYRVGEFIDWMSRATDAGFTQSLVPEVLYLRRVHATNTTGNQLIHTEYLKIVQSALKRKRAKIE